MLRHADYCSSVCSYMSMLLVDLLFAVFFFQAEDGIRDLVRSRGLGDVYKRQIPLGGQQSGDDLPLAGHPTGIDAQ